MVVVQRLRSGSPFVLALAVLVFIIWSGWQALAYPYDGIVRYTSSGVIQEINPRGPSSSILQVGDQVISIDGVKFSEAFPFYQDKHAGDDVSLLIKRGEATFTRSFTLVHAPPWEIAGRLAPLVLALTFWGIGLALLAFNVFRESLIQPFLFFQVSATFLSAGVNTYIGPQWTSSLFGVLFWLIGPFAVHFHVNFPQNFKQRYQQQLVVLLYIVAGIACLPYFIIGPERLRSLAWFQLYTSALRYFVALNLLIVVTLLVYAYRNTTETGARAKIRLVVLGGVLSFVPLVMLFILPEALLGEPVISYGLFPFFLALFPITYGYAIFRHQLIAIESHVNRGATVILVYSLLGGVYLLLNFVLAQVAPLDVLSAPALNTVIVLLLVSIFVPLQRVLSRFVDTIFYGGWYDYRSAITTISQGTEQIGDLQQLADLISNRLHKTLRLEEVCVFFSDIKGNYSIVSVAPQPTQRDQSAYSALPRSSLNYLLQMGGTMERVELKKALAQTVLSPEEERLLNSPQMHLWVPIIGHGRMLGLIALGPKFGGDEFSTEDLDIMRVLARQLSPLIENIHLVTQLRRHAEDLEQRVLERTAELNAAMERSQAILASVGEGVIVIDLIGHIQTVNEAYERQSGYQNSELTGQSIWSLYEIADLDLLRKHINETLEHFPTWTGELRGKRKNGDIYDVQLTISPLRNPNREVYGFVGSQRDVTRQKELDRLKDLFVSDVSHELRTPTTNIGLYLELLESAPDDRRDGYLNILKEQTQLLIKLVEDILDLSRLSSGKAREVEFREIDLNRLVHEVVIAHKPLANMAGLQLSFEGSQAPAIVAGDINQLSRVVTNLVYNALNYTVKGDVKVRVFADEDDIILQVQDTGIGIDEEDLPHIFERFYRGKRVRQTKKHGTGLGLSIVKEIVDRHAGTIQIQSKVGQGSTFTVKLPSTERQKWPEKSF